MTGETVQAVGSAVNSDVSQVVNDPKLLKEALDTLGNQLINAVKTELPESSLTAYVEATEELKAELTGPKDPSKVHRLLKTLALAGDIEGSLSLAARVLPYVAAFAAFGHHLGIT